MGASVRGSAEKAVGVIALLMSRFALTLALNVHVQLGGPRWVDASRVLDIPIRAVGHAHGRRG